MTVDIEKYTNELGRQARAASYILANASTELKNTALAAISDAIIENESFLMSENHKDLEAGKKNGLSDAMLDRLALNPDRIAGMLEGLRQVASLQDPIGEISDMSYRPSGIQVGKMRVPLGVIGIIL